ncbi:DUF4397 domain-containing protein [Lujinxingia litoralis]|uniref:DUF4397 domain-containing protein n=1 Tax=Lujinxingia litoralis TaxID=2211119 RepID=UPI001314385E|nr:DUF4397 domain-containing protein [Lujinxingia litoralis]
MSDDECGAGSACFDGECVLRSSECLDDFDCEGHQQCAAGQCINNTSCDTATDCAPGQTCDDEGACVERQCSRSSQCPESYVCDEGLCRTTPRQCTEVGQDCVPGDATRSGFACEDIGDGPRCYETCTEYRVCGNGGQATSAYDCSSGQACVTDVSLQLKPVCRPSECGGVLSAEEDCAEIVAENPALFANGVHCGLQNGVRTCLPAGNAQENESCTAASDCEEGLVCVTGVDSLIDIQTGNNTHESYCARPCSNDGQCGGDQACIGETSGALMGMGFCGDRCEPFGHNGAQCGDDLACVPVDGVDGLCARETTRERDLYENCSDNTQCPDSSACIQIDEGVRRCLPSCDPTLGNAAQRDATCPSASTGAYTQIAHFGAELPAVDVLVDGEVILENVSFGDIAGEEGFLSLDAGERQVVVRATGGAVLFDGELEVDAGDAVVIAAVDNADADNGISVLTVPVARDEASVSGAAKVRVVHAVALPGSVDVVFVEQDSDVSVASNRHYALTAATFGAIGNYIELDAGDYDVYVFATGAFEGDEALRIFTFTAEAGAVTTEFALDSESSPLGSVPYLSAPVGRMLGGTCLNLIQGAAFIGSGFCLETCANADQWGVGGCTNANDRCDDFGDGSGVCFPSNGNEVGDACSSDSDCVDGAHCDATSTGAGVCRSYCQPAEQTNDALGCESGEICVGQEGIDNFGKCRIPCNAGADNTDPNCPADQQGCFGPEGQTYCQPSGDVAFGEDCGQPSKQNCEAGMVCARRSNTLGGFLQSAFTDATQLGAPGGVCSQVCEPFVGDGGDSGCSEGYACSPITPDGASTSAGHCVERTDKKIRSLQPCDVADGGKMCDENSFCIVEAVNACVEPQGICVQMCDFYGGGGCTDGTVCEPWSDDGPLFGVFGICR